MGYDKGYGDSYSQSSSYSQTSVFATLMRNVYIWMTCGLLMTGLTAMIIAKDYNLINTIFNTNLYWLLLIAEIGLVFFISSMINRISFVTAGLLFAIYSIINGATLSIIMLAYTQESIAQTFFVTAGTFGGMSLVGFFIKKDLSAMGRILIMALIGLIVASIVNIFWDNDMFTSILNYVGVIIFVGLTAYDTQKIKNMMLEAQHYGVNDQTNKIALLGSLTLYLDFVNLFLYLLRIFGRRR
ncbi:MAG: Bax inhibitor-1/YccA family protein [Bacteroidaceae bacterium]|jgi:FtsH-binding integral membrane protein|nr:Bax inhibitor-1/YccA family protein [Bacteroidaceae bacterium]